MDEVGYEETVNANYGRADLTTTLLNALRAAGKDPDALTIEDVSGFDQLHSGGRAGTLALMELAELGEEADVLDLGGAIGGPARTLAAEAGCRVTVLDLTEEFCRAGAALTARIGLGDRVRFQHGDAAAIPFEPESFDVVWMQHTAVNIADRAGLLAGIHRVLRPGGRLAMQEILLGSGGELRFPVPWARDASTSHLFDAVTTRRHLEEAGFREMGWDDVTEAVKGRLGGGSDEVGELPTLGVHLLYEEALFRQWAPAWARNVLEDRVRIVRAAFRRS